MKYFFLLLIIALAISPIFAMRSSPRQKRIEALRRKAASEGVSVKLSRRPDARDDEKSLDSVRYLLPWGGLGPDELRTWTLVHDGGRGMASDWPNWRWFEGPAPQRLNDSLAELLESLPEGITGLVVDRSGVAAHWQERGEAEDVEKLAETLKQLRESVLKLS